MPILPSNKKDKPRLKGTMFFLDVEIISYIALYALSRGVTKSFLVRALIDDWYREMRKEASEDQLIEKVAESIEGRWIISQANRRPIYKNFEEFKVQLLRELKRRQINELSLNLILKRLYEKNEKRANPDL